MKMNPEIFLRTLTESALEELPLYGESGRRLSQRRARTDGMRPAVYDAQNFEEFRRRLASDDDTIRFVIDKEGNPFFGEVGNVRGSTPGHEEMSGGLCRAAGTISLDDTKTICTGISYQSGYFKPDISSLVWILKYLFSEESVLRLSSTLKVLYISDVARTSWDRLEIQTLELKNEVDSWTLTPSLYVEGITVPFATFPDEAPVVKERNGLVCSDSFDDLVAMSVASGQQANNNSSSRATQRDRLFSHASAEENDDNAVQALKRVRTTSFHPG